MTSKGTQMNQTATLVCNWTEADLRVRPHPFASYCRRCLRALVDGKHPEPLVTTTPTGAEGRALRRLAAEITRSIRDAR